MGRRVECGNGGAKGDERLERRRRSSSEGSSSGAGSVVREQQQQRMEERGDALGSSPAQQHAPKGSPALSWAEIGRAHV